MRLATSRFGGSRLWRFSLETFYIIVMLAVGVGTMSSAYLVFAEVVRSAPSYAHPESLLVLFYPTEAGQRDSLTDYDARIVLHDAPAIQSVASYSFASSSVALPDQLSGSRT